MKFPSKYVKLMPFLLIIGPIIFLTADQIEYNLKQPQKNNSSMMQHEKLIHDHDKEKTDHSNPETQKRMGIFHYNEGNKFLKQNKSEEAIRNYKMALHHNKFFEEAYINLSTAYLRKKNFILSKKNLKTLESINPKHPLLHYNFACYYSLLGNIPEGIKSLNLAISYGFKNYKNLEVDPDIHNLRKSPQFQKIRSLLLAKE